MPDGDTLPVWALVHTPPAGVATGTQSLYMATTGHMWQLCASLPLPTGVATGTLSPIHGHNLLNATCDHCSQACRCSLVCPLVHSPLYMATTCGMPHVTTARKPLPLTAAAVFTIKDAHACVRTHIPISPPHQGTTLQSLTVSSTGTALAPTSWALCSRGLRKQAAG